MSDSDSEEENGARCSWKPLECLICQHTACGWCPDCSPQVPDL